MKIRKAISGFTSVIIWALAILLLLCLLCAYLNPAVIAFSGLLTLLTPVLILLNIIALVYALVRGKLAGWITFIVLILSVPQIGNLWGFNFIHKQAEGTTFRLMTYNVRNFDLYNWDENEKSREQIFNMLRENKPDIICFQEFYSKPGGHWDNISDCRTDLGLDHYYFTRELILDEGRQWGIATFSRFPIVRTGEIMQIPEKNSRGLQPFKGIFTDLSIGEDTLRVFNIHLASIYLAREDYTTLENIAGQQEIDINRSRYIVAKLMRAFRKRGGQVKQLLDFLASEEQVHPVIIAGDFNDTPTSYAYNKLSKGLQDAWTCSNWGPGATYNGPIPALRIDQILVDETLSVARTRVVNSRISDHSPMIADIEMP
jgi:endonuclease/exonuclease/phosphatase family metal-dependent hydrolase